MLFVAIIIIVFIYLVIDYLGPKTIALKKTGHEKLQNVLSANELIVQEYDKEGNLWASRGMVLYCLKKNETKFKRALHVPTGLSIYFFYNFKLFRWFVNKPECIVSTVSAENHYVVMSAGYMWHCPASSRKFKKVFKLRSFGRGIGRGIFSNGILTAENNHIYFGEYFRNSKRGDVKIYVSKDNGSSWSTAYEFPTGKIRHVHGIQQDPYDGKLWVCCGDWDNESVIAYSEDNFKTLIEIGSGSQGWRTCQLVFTKEQIYWGADTGEINFSGIYRWDKISHQASKVCTLKGAVLYGTALEGGTKIFTTDREGFDNEEDPFTRVVKVDANDVATQLEIGTWKHSKKNYRYSFAMLRIPRNPVVNKLCVSIINQNEYPMGKLLMVNEDDLKIEKQIISENEASHEKPLLTI